MRMPGFSAGASVNENPQRFRAVAGRSATRDRVVPADYVDQSCYGACHGSCMRDCTSLRGGKAECVAECRLEARECAQACTRAGSPPQQTVPPPPPPPMLPSPPAAATQCTSGAFQYPSILYCTLNPADPGADWSHAFSNATLPCLLGGGIPKMISGSCSSFSGSTQCVSSPATSSLISSGTSFCLW